MVIKQIICQLPLFIYHQNMFKQLVKTFVFTIWITTTFTLGFTLTFTSRCFIRIIV